MNTPSAKPQPAAWLITNHAPMDIASCYSFIPTTDDVIAVDKGLEKVHELGLVPRVIIGDFDSLNEDLLQSYTEVPIIRHPSAKNETDTELALAWCLAQQMYAEVIICNDLQGRWDHSLALLQNLLYAHEQGIPCRIESKDQVIRIICGNARIKGKPGDLLSLIAICSEAVFAHSRGLLYPLEHLVLQPQLSRGISNEFVAASAELQLEKGLVLSIQTIL